MKFTNGIELDDAEGGLLVRQHGDAYLARRWCLCDATVELVNAALQSNLRWMIREGHPQAHARWPSGKGRVYLAFSPTSENHWSMAIDSFNPARLDFGAGVFNGKYHHQFLEHDVPFVFEKRNRTAGHLVVAREHVLPVLKLMSDLDHSVLYLGRSGTSENGFSTEYDIQRALLFQWHRTPFSARYGIVGDEYPVDEGNNPRRIDILARNPETGDWLVIEVKRAEAALDAVHQIEGYLLALSQRADFLGGNLSGALIAERIPDKVRSAADNAGIEAFEATFPLELRRVA